MEIDPGEQELWSQRANHSAGWRAVGGRLCLTDRRLLFAPHGFDRFLLGREWSAPRAEVTGFGVQPKGGLNPFNGGLRSRLRVDLRQGEPQLFVVSKPDEAARELNAHLLASPPTEPA